MTEAAPQTTQTTTETTPTSKEAVEPQVPSAQEQRPDDMSSRFAALTKKERMARLQISQVKKREAQIAERERLIAEREKAWDEEFKKSPLDAIKKRGYTYEDLTKAALNDGKPDASTEVRAVREDIERLRQEQAEREKKAQEEAKTAQQRQEQAAVENFKASISEIIDAQKEKFELVHLWDAAPLVFDTVEEHYARSLKRYQDDPRPENKPRVLSIEEACQLTEEYLEQEAFEKLSGSKKFQSRFSKVGPKEEPKASPKNSTTLSNDLVSSASPSLLPPATESDRLKRALAKLG